MALAKIECLNFYVTRPLLFLSHLVLSSKGPSILREERVISWMNRTQKH